MFCQFTESHRPIGNEILIVEASLDDDLQHPQGQRTVASRPWSDPKISPLRNVDLLRIDDDQLCPFDQSCAKILSPHAGARLNHVASPEYDKAGVSIFVDNASGPEGKGGGACTRTAANMA